MRISRHVDVSRTVFHVAFVAMAVSVTQVTTEDCGQEELVQCTKPLQVLSATSELSFVTKKEELDKLCPDLHAGLHCIRSYTRRCMNIHQREHFNKLYHGTHEVIHELCQEGPYQEGTHAPCMRHVKKDYEVCAVSYQSTMAKIGQTVAHTTMHCVDYTPGSGKCRDYFSSHSTRAQQHQNRMLSWLATLTLLLAITSRLVNPSVLI
ncbi:hypothetical protein RP20_CCG008493 [Aedes albopictus]|nr:hypothetical protein RP20_CCG008493 [Aedes albopictus]